MQKLINILLTIGVVCSLTISLLQREEINTQQKINKEQSELNILLAQTLEDQDKLNKAQYKINYGMGMLLLNKLKSQPQKPYEPKMDAHLLERKKKAY